MATAPKISCTLCGKDVIKLRRHLMRCHNDINQEKINKIINQVKIISNNEENTLICCRFEDLNNSVCNAIVLEEE